MIGRWNDAADALPSAPPQWKGRKPATYRGESNSSGSGLHCGLYARPYLNTSSRGGLVGAVWSHGSTPPTSLTRHARLQPPYRAGLYPRSV